MKKSYAIGVDLGGTNLRVALVSREGEIIKKLKVPSLEKAEEALISSVGEMFEGAENVAGIGIGVAGLLDRDSSIVVISPNLPSIERVPIAEILTGRFNVPVFIENDANAAALGERLMGTGRKYRNFVLLTLGTGIGGGIIYNGKLLNVSAEIGHMSINSSGIKCACGNHGCLESYASARPILEYAINALEHGTASVLKECCSGNFYKLTPEDIYKAALDGDNLSKDVLREAGKHLGVGISNMINIFSPEAVILAGGLTGAWNIYVQEAIKEASKRTFKQLFDRVEIVQSSLGDNAGVLGSACLAFNSKN